ncbi:MAG: coproporphyrinogen dehydrogenase HemZ [Clostridia bacterium]|nr:coproporphyrinogen dehydrogenase HemZ [Clostridia bacterium]MBQ7751452.1 coproporphyrinogen dehydrogenase HemZ [Clostridia bacterium]
MFLIQNGFCCEYEMNIFINIFFGKEEGVIKTDFSDKKGEIFAKTEIEYEGKKYFGEFSLPFDSKNESERKIKKFFGVCVVRSFIDAAQKIRKITLPWGVLSGIRPAKYLRELKEEGKSEEEIKKILTEIFGVSEEKYKLCRKVAENEEKILEKVKNNSVSLYIGIPFCPSRCLYCSFVSTDVKVSGKYIDEFCDLLVREIEKTGEILRDLSISVQNIYIGGGTPTTLSEKHLEKILSAIKNNIDIETIEEFTVEAGRPDTITAEKINVLKNFGVNRISINPQTLNQETLDLIGRKHSTDDFYKAFSLAKSAGFSVINTDLIAGLPNETVEMFKYSLDRIIELNPQNITVHSMCVKRASMLNFSKIQLSKAETVEKMLSYTEKVMEKCGKEPYYMYRQKNISGNLENVGYSDREHFSRYNINIMEEVQTIIGLGGGGVSKIVKGDRIERIANFKEPYEYIKRFDEILLKKEEIKSLIKS